MAIEFAAINWYAVIAGTVAGFLLGWLWYSPMLFGKGWAAGSRVDLGTAETMPVFAMATQFLALFLLSVTIGLTAGIDALATAVLAVLAAATFVLSGGAFVRKSTYALGVDFGYIVLAGAAMIACQAIL